MRVRKGPARQHAHISLTDGFRNTMTSSAYMETRCCSPDLARGASSPAVDTHSNRHCKGSMHRMNSMGERGLPCLRPWQLYIVSPAMPLTAILVVDVANKPHIQASHFGPKPSADNTPPKTATARCHRLWICLVCNLRAVPCTSMKLSWSVRPRTKAL